jgi:hypothetical protein
MNEKMILNEINQSSNNIGGSGGGGIGVSGSGGI